ncbi:nucleotide disphospho-sugar-binding domain-containing protein [Streptomyces sp. NPDC021098]|uniref:nucleotide disphospho-sugar-binding domain-containing protein n=1 Tax=unclassified Streptomyces TaxID=2593676 RepID=UPI0037B173A5
MRVLFTTWAPGGHLVALVPLARAFLAAGHQVRVAVPGGCAAAVARAGLMPVPAGVLPRSPGLPPAVARRARGIWPADWPVRPGVLGQEQHGVLRALGDRRVAVAEAMAQGLVAYARCWQPELVVHDASTYAGTVAAAALGVPAVGQLWGSAALLRLDRQRLDGPPLPGYARLMRRYGADPAREPQVWLDPCPPSLALPSPERRLPVRFVPYEAPHERPYEPHYASRYEAPYEASYGAYEGARDAVGEPSYDPNRPGPGAGPTRICAVWEDPAGPPEGVRAALRAAEARGVEVVRLGTAADGPPPAVPLHRVLPGCRAVLHQGGGAAVLAAAVAGVPQLIVAPRPEQQLNGVRVALAGAGAHTPAGLLGGSPRTARAAGAQLARDLFALLEQPSYVVAARALREEARSMPGPEAAVARLTARA